jgi:hypothetical protein
MTSPTQKTEREEALEAWSFPQLIEEYATAKSILTLSAERGAFENYPMQSRLVSELWGAIMSRLLSSSKAEGEMREALKQCAAPFLARGGQTLTVEFQRRMDIAHEALAALSPKEDGK